MRKSGFAAAAGLGSLALLLTACGGSSGSSSNSATTSTAQPGGQAGQAGLHPVIKRVNHDPEGHLLLELGRAYGHGPKPPRTVMFLAVTAEEKGLLGSEYYASSPL